MHNYQWDEVQKLASALLAGMSSASDLDCAQAIWKLLETDKLTGYSNEIEKTEVLVLQLSLIEFVNDCTALIEDENCETDIVSWAYEAEINQFRIAQAMENDFEAEEEYNEDELFEAALLQLLTKGRETITRCILKKFPEPIDVMKFIGGFYVSSSDDDGDYENMAAEQDYIIPANTLAFYGWIDEGMERRS
jgi:hypothetical protein